MALVQKDFEEALDWLKHMFQMGRESGGFQHEMCAALGYSAGVLVRLGRYEEAFEYCHENLATSLRTSNKLEYGRAYMVLSEIHASEAYRDWEKADGYLEQSIRAFREAGARSHLGEAYLTAARIGLKRQDGTAHRWAEKARDLFSECGAKGFLKEAEEFLASLE
jgi:tetratricopeptide (TPR) repeat protein